MAETNYPATLGKMKAFLDQKVSDVTSRVKQREALIKSIDSGTTEPNSIKLTATQKNALKASLAELDTWVDANASEWEVEPVSEPVVE